MMAALRDLWRRLSARKQHDEEPDSREGRSLHESREVWEQQQFGVQPPGPSGQDKPKH